MMFPSSVLADHQVLPMVKANTIKPGEVIQALEPNIVAVMGVCLAGIP